MPLEVGHTWLYEVKAPVVFETYIEPVKVTREISVANGRGVEMSGALGPSRLAWTGDTLLAERLINTQFAPPLPLLFNTDETHERRWKGAVTFVDATKPGGSPATATESQTGDDQLSFSGRKIHCVRSTVLLKTASQEIELTTWFSAGLGIVQQEQRTDKILLLRLKLLDAKSL